jgi:hypothetical protein
LPRAGASASTLANATTPTARETTTRHRERTNAKIARMFARRSRRLRARASTRDDDSMRVRIAREFHETCDSTAVTRFGRGRWMREDTVRERATRDDAATTAREEGARDARDARPKAPNHWK